jgi:hypothetical protein
MTNQAPLGQASPPPLTKAGTALVPPPNVVSMQGLTTQATIAPTSTQPTAVVGTASLPAPSLVSTPTGTVAITLTPPPAAPVPLYSNVVFWVAIISFFGVVLSLWQAHNRMTKELSASEDRLRTQLKASADEATIERNQSRDQANLDRQHDTEQAHQERITKARREVYLELISEMTKAQFAISSLPMQDVQKLEIQAGFGGLITATSKISILGEMPTVTMSRELLSAINESLIRALILVIPINEHKDTEKEQEKQLSQQRLEIARVKREMKVYIDNGTTFSKPFNDLRQELIWRDSQLSVHGQAIGAASLSFHEAQKNYFDALLGETKAISQKADELICAIRAELGLVTSLDELRASSTAMHASAQSALRGLHASLGNAEPLSKSSITGLAPAID